MPTDRSPATEHAELMIAPDRLELNIPLFCLLAKQGTATRGGGRVPGHRLPRVIDLDYRSTSSCQLPAMEMNAPPHGALTPRSRLLSLPVASLWLLDRGNEIGPGFGLLQLSRQAE